MWGEHTEDKKDTKALLFNVTQIYTRRQAWHVSTVTRTVSISAPITEEG